MGRAPSRHRPPWIANGGGGAALGLERARVLASAGAGTRGGRGESCQRGYKGGKSSLRGEPGGRTLVRRPQRQGGAGKAGCRGRRPSIATSPSTVSLDLGNVPESGGLVHSGHGWRRKARRETGAAGGAHTAGGAPAHLPLGTDPPARPTRRQVAGHRAPCLRRQPLGTAAPRGQPPHQPPRRGGRHGKLAHSQRGGAWR